MTPDGPVFWQPVAQGGKEAEIHELDLEGPNLEDPWSHISGRHGLGSVPKLKGQVSLGQRKPARPERASESSNRA